MSSVPLKTFLLLAGAMLTIAGMPAMRAQEMMAGEKTPSGAAKTSSAGAKPASRAGEILKRFDKNGDGRLDDDEKADAHEVMLQETMAKEAPPPGTQGLAFFEALAVELFDRDHDGRLDERERTQATEFLERDDPAGSREVLLIRFDVNRDGKLVDAERRESEAYTVEHRGEFLREVLLRRYDVNSNGQFEPEEKMAIRAAYQAFPSPLASVPAVATAPTESEPKK